MSVLRLTGTAGMVAGTAFSVERGMAVVLGRSRACGISLHGLGETPEARGDTPEGRAFRAVSRRHVTLRFEDDGRLHVVDRSRHGTFVDGERIETAILLDLSERAHELRLGPVETFRISLA